MTQTGWLTGWLATRPAGDRARVFDALALLAITAYLFGGLLAPVFLATHEGAKPYARAMMYLVEMRAGAFPVTMFSDSVFGAGAAFPLFYPPLAYTVAGLMQGALGDPALGVNVAAFVAVLASAFFMRYLLLEMGASRAWALLAAVAYISAPYRFGLLYTRGALAESFALVWFPLVVLGIWRCTRHRHYPVLLVASAALALLSHSITAIYFALCATAFAVATLSVTRWRGATMLGLAGLHVAALVAFYVVPLKMYLPLTHGADPEFIRATADVVRAHRVEVSQLFVSAAGVGDGYSLEGPIDGMSFELGAAPLLLLGLLAWSTTRREGVAPQLLMHRWFLAIGTVAMVLSVVFMLVPGLFLGMLPAAFDYIQFPWRLLGQVAFLSALCLGLCGFLVPRRHATAIALALMVFLIARVPDSQRQPRVSVEWTRGGLSGEQAASLDGYFGFTDLGEYLPFSFPGGRIRDTAHRPTVVAPPEAGAIEWRRLDHGRWQLTAPSVGNGGCLVRLPLLAYPFYAVRSETVADDNLAEDEGFLAVWLPEGPHEAIIERRRPRSLQVSLAVSGVALALLLAIALAQRRVPVKDIN